MLYHLIRNLITNPMVCILLHKSIQILSTDQNTFSRFYENAKEWTYIVLSNHGRILETVFRIFFQMGYCKYDVSKQCIIKLFWHEHYESVWIEYILLVLLSLLLKWKLQDILTYMFYILNTNLLCAHFVCAFVCTHTHPVCVYMPVSVYNLFLLNLSYQAASLCRFEIYGFS